MASRWARHWRVAESAAAAIVGCASLLVLTAGAQKPATVTGQVTVTIEGQQKFAADARVHLMTQRPASFAYSEERTVVTLGQKAAERAKSDKEAALAEWNGFWPASYYRDQWSKRLFSPLTDPAKRKEESEAYAKAYEEGRIDEYEAQKKYNECTNKTEAVDLSVAATLEKAEQENRQYLIVAAATDEQGKFSLSNVTPGRFVVIARARLDSLEVYWLAEGEVKPGKAAVANLSKPIFTCTNQAEPKQ